MDERGRRAYLGTMLRKLLTLLAICAGLTAVAEPARAAMIAVENVQVLDRVAPAFRASGAAAFEPGAPAVVWLADKVKPCPKPTIVLIVPAVMLQADRARE